MKESFNKYKGLILEKTKEIVNEYGRYIAGGIVILMLFVICGTTLAGRIADNKMPSGVMMTVPEVAKDKEPFSGNVFYVDGYSYEEMVNAEYLADQAENIEKTENEIQQILAARQEERQKKAAKEAVQAAHSGPKEVAAYDPEYQGTPNVSGSESSTPSTSPSVPASAPTQYTYDDGNGTYVSLGEFELTAYCPCPICCGIYSNMTNPTTASGTRATEGRTIAVDTSIIPFGSKVMINGKIYTAEDTGGAIKGNRIDIYFESHTQALYFGRQKATVYLVK